MDLRIHLSSILETSQPLSVQKRVHTEGLRLLSLESPACKNDPWLTSGNLDFGRVPATSRKIVQTVWFMLNHRWVEAAHMSSSQ